MKARGIALVALLALSAQGVSGNEHASCPAPGAKVTEPYRWYPALDLARIPFHHADGPWGPRTPIKAPAPPVTRRTVRVTTASELAAEAKVPGTQITLDAGYIGRAVVAGNVVDLDIVVPPGRTLAQLWIGTAQPRTWTRRVRIRGLTPGVHSGGLIGRIIFYSDAPTDLIVDGVDLNGNDGEAGGLLLQFPWNAERVAVVNVRGHSVGSATVGGGTDIVFAGNHLMTGAREREVNGYPEGWGIRAGGRIVLYDNRIEGTRYHRLRVHPGHPDQRQRPEYAWVANNIFVDRHEGRIFNAWEASGTQPHHYAAVWVVCNRVYAHSSCMPSSFEAQHADYARLTSNSFFGSLTADFQGRLATHQGSGRDYASGNDFSPWRAPPAWEAPNDPNAVPLPPVNPSRYNAALVFRPCPPP